MNKQLFLSLLAALMLSGWVIACKTNDPAAQATTGPFTLQLDNVVGNEDLVLKTGRYTNSSGEEFRVTTLNYYLSNFRFKQANGAEYVVPQDSSYFLVKESDKASQLITFPNVPMGSYTAVTFTIGVDSVRSVSDIGKRKGVLDPAGSATAANDMYWEWNSGYIFLKFEGTSPVAPVDATGQNTFQYHIGFFGGLVTKTLNNLKTVTLSLGQQPAVVAENNSPQVTIKADVQAIFGQSTKLSIAQHPAVMVDPYSATIASNYSQLFRYDQTRQLNHN
ncbi:MAG: hypothetical protein JWP57_1142 [Spirosoma sp.]|nr:hypothetical protein [Spirosoma sp.]